MKHFARSTNIALLLISTAMLAVVVHFGKWNRGTIKWDPAGYYIALPATFIYGDLSQFAFYEKITKEYQIHDAISHVHQVPGHHKVMKYSLGMSILYAPGFFIGHGLAHLSGSKIDGYSPPYILGLNIWACLFYILGFLVLRQVLIRRFTETTTTITLLALFFCTNLLIYTTFNNFMSHGFLFTLYACLLYLLDQLDDEPSAKNYASVGLLTGLMVLVRPSELMLIVLVLLWSSTSVKEVIRNNLRRWKTHRLLYTLLGALVIGMIQLIYWKWSTGELLYYSYRDQGFNFLAPKIDIGLFSWRKGWLVYTPLMALALIGSIIGLITRKTWGLSIFIFLFVVLYVTFSWSDLFYGGSVGCRALIQHYAVFSIPIAWLIQLLWKSNWWRLVTSVFLMGCLYQNVVMTYHSNYDGGIWDADSMSKKLYLKVLSNGFKKDRRWNKLLDNPYEYDLDQAQESRILFESSFENDTVRKTDTSSVYSGLKAMVVDTMIITSVPINIPVDETLSTKDSWIIIQFQGYMGWRTWDTNSQTAMHILKKHRGKTVSYTYYRIERLLERWTWTPLSFELPLYEERVGNTYLAKKLEPGEKIDEISIYLENRGADHPIWVDDLKVIWAK